MKEMTIEVAGNGNHAPGDEVCGAVQWKLDTPPTGGQARLIWFTRGRAAESDRNVIETVELTALQAPSKDGQGPYRASGGAVTPLARIDARHFQFRLPEAPYSYLGKLVSIAWAIEVALEPSGFTKRAEIVSAPGGEPLVHK